MTVAELGQVVRLGGKYERATLDERMAIEQEFAALEKAHSESYLSPFFVRGRNVIRRARKQELLNV